MLSSRTASSSLFVRHEPLQSAQTIFRRTYANSQSKRHKRKAQVPTRPPIVRHQKRVDHIYRSATSLFRKEPAEIIKAERRNRREDWELGPLKPWREAVVAKPMLAAEDKTDAVHYFGEANDLYGTLSARHKESYPVVPQHRRIKNWFIRVGDRVCLVEGRESEKGRIGMVEEVDKRREMVTIKGVNMVDLRRPAYMAQPGEATIETTEMPVSFRDVRLVYPIADPVTGIYRDCIINHLEMKNRRRDPFRSFDPEEQWTFDRFLMPQNMRIPWPEETEPKEADREFDTKREMVEESTFLPTLLRPPMPEDVSAELKESNPGFKGRMKVLDVDFVDPKKEQDEKRLKIRETKQELKPRGAKNLARGIRSGKGEFMKSKDLPQFDQETLQTIAKHMEAARSKRAQGATGSVVPLPSQSASSEQQAPN